MRVLAIAQGLPQDPAQGVTRGKGLVALVGEPGGDSGVIGGGASIGLVRQPPPQLKRDGAIVVAHLAHDHLVIARVRHHRHEIVILGRRPDHAGPADIDVFHRCGGVGSRGYRGLEGIKIDHHQIDGGDAVFFHGREMVLRITPGQDAAVNKGVEGLDPAPHNFREAGLFRYVAYGNADLAQGLGRAAGGKDINPAFGEKFPQCLESRLVGDGDQGAADGNPGCLGHALSCLVTGG